MTLCNSRKQACTHEEDMTGLQDEKNITDLSRLVNTTWKFVFLRKPKAFKELFRVHLNASIIILNYETNIAVFSRVTTEIGATHQDGHLSLLRNVHTTDSSLLCYVTGYPRRLKLWEQLAHAYDPI